MAIISLKSVLAAPRTSTGYPHEGPSGVLVSVLRNADARLMPRVGGERDMETAREGGREGEREGERERGEGE